MAFANVQRNGKGANAASISIGAGDGWATPSTGNLLVVTANSDALVSITGTWTAGPSVIDGNGTYIWYRISDGTETTITCTPSVSDKICITAAEYSGNTASPFDVSNTSTIASSSGTTTTNVSVTTTAAGDLVIAAACLHSYGGGTNPASPSWTNSFTNQITAASTAGAPDGADCTTFYAELVAGAAGGYSTSASWTNAASDRQELVIAFKAATATSIPYNPQRTVQPRDIGEAYWLQRERRTSAAAPADPLIAPLLEPQSRITWPDRRTVPQQRTYPTVPAVDATVPHVNATPVAAGQAWPTPRLPRQSPPGLLDTAQLEIPPNPIRPPHQRTPWLRQTFAQIDQSTAGVADTFDPTLAGSKLAYLTPAMLTSRRAVPQQRAAFADIDVAATIGPAAAAGWSRGDDTAPYLYGNLRHPTVPEAAPSDPLTVAWGAGGMYWLLYNTAAVLVGRRGTPQQPDRESDPALVAEVIDPTTVAAGVGGDMWRRVNVLTDRRVVAPQPPRRTVTFDAGPGLPPLTLAWGAGGSLWQRYHLAADVVDRAWRPQQRPRPADLDLLATVEPVNATSTATVTAGRSSTATATARRTSTVAVTHRSGSTPAVSDG